MTKIFHIPLKAEIASALERRAQSCGLTTDQLLQRIIQILAAPVVRTRRKYEYAAGDYLSSEPVDLPSDPLEREVQDLEVIRRLAGLADRDARPVRR
jgi:hypothetical protein